MGFTVEFNGVPVICDTLADVQAITEVLRTSGKPLSGNGKRSEEGPSTAKAVVRKLGPNAKKALKALMKAENHRLSDAELCSHLGLRNNNQLAGVLSSIPKEANRARVDVTSFFKKEVAMDNERRRVAYYEIPRDMVQDVKEGLNG